MIPERRKLIEKIKIQYFTTHTNKQIGYTLNISFIIICLFISINFRINPLNAQEHASPKIRITPKYLSKEESRHVKLYQKVLPTIVTIFTSRNVITMEGNKQQDGIGSGVLISPDCHVLTAAHVVNYADEIMVKTQDGKLRPAELLFSESSADIALLKLSNPDLKLEHAKLGNSDKLAVGQKVFVIGSPYGLENSFSAGYISGFRNFDRLYDGTISAEFIQTDAAINSGNSGGPLFNSNGEVVGIASHILSISGGFQGLGFVVAINTAKQLLALEDRVWIGIEGIFLNSDGISKIFNRQLGGGILVLRVVKASPADKAGLRGGSIPAHLLNRNFLLGGDLIIEFGTQEACHSDCLVEANKKMAGLDHIPVKFLRGGNEMETVIDVSTSRQNFLLKQ